MKLTDLEPQWVNHTEGGGHHRFCDVHSHVNHDAEDVEEGYHNEAEDFAHADGVTFLCPTCFKKNNGRVGTEHVLVWFRGRPNVPADAVPGPGRWGASGTSFDDLTLTPSVNVSHEHWHGFVTNGEVT